MECSPIHPSAQEVLVEAVETMNIDTKKDAPYIPFPDYGFLIDAGFQIVTTSGGSSSEDHAPDNEAEAEGQIMPPPDADNEAEGQIVPYLAPFVSLPDQIRIGPANCGYVYTKIIDGPSHEVLYKCTRGSEWAPGDFVLFLFYEFPWGP